MSSSNTTSIVDNAISPFSNDLSHIAEVIAPTAVKLSRCGGGVGGSIPQFEDQYTFLEDSVFGGSVASEDSSSRDSSLAGSPAQSGIISDPLIASSNDYALGFDYTFPPLSKAEPFVDLEKQQQHHLQQFLYYQSLAIQRQQAATKNLAAQQEIDQLLVASSASVPSLSPTPSTPAVVDISPGDTTRPMQYQYPQLDSSDSSKLDAFVAGHNAAQHAQQQQMMANNGFAHRATQSFHIINDGFRHSFAGYPLGPTSSDPSMVYGTTPLYAQSRNSFDAGALGNGVDRDASLSGYKPSTNFFDQGGDAGFGGSANMQMSASSGPSQVGLVKGPYLMSNQADIGFYGAGNGPSYDTQQDSQQQVDLHRAVTNAAYAAMYQPIQQQSFSSVRNVEQQQFSVQLAQAQQTVPYAAPDLSVPSYYRVHSADPSVAQAAATGAVKMESISPRTAAATPLLASVEPSDEGKAPGSSSTATKLPPSAASSKANSVAGDVDVSKVVLNPLGGGRGYIPGETPDDPKKRHKCDVCGRGFARLFNLKVSLPSSFDRSNSTS
jgi:hypothetical protein